MPGSTKLADLKRRVSAAVLGIPGVAGVGLPAAGITIYLTKDDPAVRQAVLKAVDPLSLPVPLHWSVTGKFEKR